MKHISDIGSPGRTRTKCAT